MTDRTEQPALARAIAEWLRAAMERAGATRLVLGLSGGVDSAVVCALSALAAGPERVIAAILPVHSAGRDLAHAEAVAKTFAVTPQVIDLTPVYDALIAALPDAIGSDSMSDAANQNNDANRTLLALANIKPRLRMTTLYYLANRYNGLVVGTGNKTELSIGYFTKYGDGGVDLLPLGELDKTAVWQLARELGVPEAIVAKAPSAGLWEGQTDEAEIGLTYAELDRALREMAAGRGNAVAPDMRARITALAIASEHKRTMPPVFPLVAIEQR